LVIGTPVTSKSLSLKVALVRLDVWITSITF
jgi:hypothetical protein